MFLIIWLIYDSPNDNQSDGTPLYPPNRFPF